MVDLLTGVTQERDDRLMAEESDIQQDASFVDEPSPRWRGWRWAAPVGLAVVVLVAAVGVRLAAGGGSQAGPTGGPGARPHGHVRTPRFVLTVGNLGDRDRSG